MPQKPLPLIISLKRWREQNGFSLSPAEIGSNIEWFAAHDVNVEYIPVENSNQEMLLIHIPE